MPYLWSEWDFVVIVRQESEIGENCKTSAFEDMKKNFFTKKNPFCNIVKECTIRPIIKIEVNVKWMEKIIWEQNAKALKKLKDR